MTFRVLKFWTNYAPTASGELRATDMVAYAPIGKANMVVNVDAVARLQKLQPVELAADNPAVGMAHARWRAIEPEYVAWKKGHEMPLNGTPLAAWSGVSQDQADALRRIGIRTVEEIAEAGEGILSKMPVPKPRELQSMAQVFLKAADRNKSAAQMSQLEERNKVLEDQLEEMRQIVLEMQAASKETKRGPGRPPKPREDEAAAA